MSASAKSLAHACFAAPTPARVLVEELLAPDAYLTRSKPLNVGVLVSIIAMAVARPAKRVQHRGRRDLVNSMPSPRMP